MHQKVIKAGNSKAVTVPAEFTRNVGVRIGDAVEVRLLPEKGQVIYTFSGVRQLSLNGKLLKKVLVEGRFRTQR